MENDEIQWHQSLNGFPIAHKLGDKRDIVNPTQPGISNEQLVSKRVNWRGTNISPIIDANVISQNAK